MRSRSLDRVLVALRELGQEQGATLSQLARHIGCSPEAVGQQLRAAPSNIVHRDSSQWPHRWWLAPAAISSLDGRLCGTHRRTGRALADWATVQVERAHTVLRDGQPTRAARILRDHGLSAADLIPRLSLRNRGQLIAALAYIDGDIAMAAGNADRAIFRLDRAARAAREHAPHLVAEILATKAAGLRMRNISSLELAVEAYDEAGAWVAQASTEQGQARLAAWITRSRSTPYAILGDWPRAAEAIEQAGETCADLDSAAEAEKLLLSTRILLGTPCSRSIQRAADAVERAAKLAATCPPWVQGWVPRYEADLMMAAHPQQEWATAAPLLERAWYLNKSYGFQRRLVLARLADMGDHLSLEEVLQPEMLRSLTQVVAQAHPGRHARSILACPQCRSAQLHQRIRHALDIDPGASQGFLR